MLASLTDNKLQPDGYEWCELQSSEEFTWPEALDRLVPQRPIASKDEPREKFEGLVQFWREWDPQANCAVWNKIYRNGHELEAFNQWEFEFLAQLAQLKVHQTYRPVSLVREGTAFDPKLLDGGHGARYLIKTRDAGPTLYDWLRMPVRYEGQLFAHWLVFPENYLLMVQSLLRALEAIHTNRYVHCDLHAGNISIPAEILQSSAGNKPFDVSNLSVQLNSSHLTLIDFGFSINCQKAPYTTLPFAQEGYRARISPHLKNVLTTVKEQTLQKLGSGQHWDEVWLNASFWQRLDGASPLDLIRTIDWREDLYQLGHLLADIRDGTGEARHLGGRTVRKANQSSINALIDQLPEQLMHWGEGVGTPTPQEKPHQEYINRIDAAITSARNHGDAAITAFAIDFKDYGGGQSSPNHIVTVVDSKPSIRPHRAETILAHDKFGNAEKIAIQTTHGSICNKIADLFSLGGGRNANKPLPINIILIGIGIMVLLSLAVFGYTYIKDVEMKTEIHRQEEMAKIESERKRIAAEKTRQKQAEIARLAEVVIQAKKEQEAELRREAENNSLAFVDRKGSEILNAAYPLALKRLVYKNAEAYGVTKTDDGYTATIKLHYLNLLGASHDLDIAFSYSEKGEYIAWKIVDFSDFIPPKKLTLAMLHQLLISQK